MESTRAERLVIEVHPAIMIIIIKLWFLLLDRFRASGGERRKMRHRIVLVISALMYFDLNLCRSLFRFLWKPVASARQEADRRASMNRTLVKVSSKHAGPLQRGAPSFGMGRDAKKQRRFAALKAIAHRAYQYKE